MLVRLALRNVRRSVRDYAIYFITLTLAVAVFYAFNAIGDSRVLFEVQDGVAARSAEMLEGFSSVFSLLSAVIAVVLGFLVLYANRYIVRRRKAEFGTYLLLGMKPAQVSGIILVEGAAVGLLSLAAGLGLGFLLSQFISLGTANMLGQALQSYTFVFSPRACTMTLACFALIFAVVALFNVFQIARCKLIDLLSARSRSEKMPVRNPWVCLVAFVASVALIVVAYQALRENGMVMLFDDDFKKATAFMLAGTLLLFWSLSGFVVLLLTKVPRAYFKGLAMFTVRQIASKVNTAFVSLWAVCILLFFSMTVFSCGMGLASLFAGDVGETAPYDATISSMSSLMNADAGEGEESPSHEKSRALWREYDGDAVALFSEKVPSWDDVVTGAAQVDIWENPDFTYRELIDKVGSDVADNDSYRDQPVQMISVSQFNGLRALTGAKAVNLADDEFAVDNQITATDEFSRDLANFGGPIRFCGVDLKPSGEVFDQSLYDTQMSDVSAVIVVPDSVVETLRDASAYPSRSFVNLNVFGTGKQATIDSLMAEYGQAFPPASEIATGQAYASLPWPASYYDTKESAMGSALGTKLLMVYLSLYIGFVFLVTTAAVLSVQQLSEVTESLPRYRLLAKLGCDKGMILGSLRVQVGVYFAAPLVVAACHSACAITVMFDSLFKLISGTQVASTLVFSAVAVAGVYLLYLLATYFAARSAVVASVVKGRS